MKKLILSLSLLLAFVSVAYSQTPTCLVGSSGGPVSASLTFVAPTANTDGTPISTPLTYNLYQATVSGAEIKVASGVKGSPLSVTTGLTPRTTYYWKVSVVDANGNESALSNEACKTFAASVPGTVTITVQ